MRHPCDLERSWRRPPWRVTAAIVAAVAMLAPATLPAAAGIEAASAPCSVRVPLLVVGGTPAGVAAAVSAARLGTPVLLTEARPYLGGDLTGGMLNVLDMDVDVEGRHLARGFFLEVYHRLGMTFDVEYAKKVFAGEVRQEPLITLRLRTRPIAVLAQGPWVTGVVVQDDIRSEPETICAQRIIDATDDADIAAMAGVPYQVGREGSGIDRAMMAATLVFQVGGVSWRQMTSFLFGSAHRAMVRAGIRDRNIWGFGPTMRKYTPTQPGVAIYDLNIGLQNDGSVLINGLLLFGVDGTNPASVADAMQRGRTELPSLIEYLRQNVPGFAHAFLIRAADYLYVRETRHIRGLYTLRVRDIEDSRVFWDAIGVASYPIDLHPYRPGQMNPYAARRIAYTIPFRSLVPVSVANLLVASRSISASYEAAGSARIAATTMEEGQAAGLAAALSLQARVSFRKMAETPALVHQVQAALYAEGAYLPPETLSSLERFVPPWPARRPPFGPGENTPK
jgi:hypothetical protein